MKSSPDCLLLTHLKSMALDAKKSGSQLAGVLDVVASMFVDISKGGIRGDDIYFLADLLKSVSRDGSWLSSHLQTGDLDCHVCKALAAHMFGRA